MIRIILISLILAIKSELWLPTVDGYNTNDYFNGYAGGVKQPMTDFYLCGKRHYRVHFIGDDKNTWSEKFTNCQTVGDGRQIDGITIDGGKNYRIKVVDAEVWFGEVNGFDIEDENNGYAGLYGMAIESVAVDGGDVYRYALWENSSNPKSLGPRIIKMLFDMTISNSEYGEKNDVITNNILKATSQILYHHEVELDANNMIRIILNKGNRFNEQSLMYDDFGGEIEDDLNQIIEKKFGFKDDLKEKFINVIHCGTISIYFIWAERKIQIEIGVRTSQDIDNFRGGHRTIIYVKNNAPLLNNIKELVLLFTRYTDTNGRNNIKKEMENFNDITQLSEVEKNIPMYSGALNRVILSLILNSSQTINS